MTGLDLRSALASPTPRIRGLLQNQPTPRFCPTCLRRASIKTRMQHSAFLRGLGHSIVPGNSTPPAPANTANGDAFARLLQKKWNHFLGLAASLVSDSSSGFTAGLTLAQGLLWMVDDLWPPGDPPSAGDLSACMRKRVDTDVDRYAVPTGSIPCGDGKAMGGSAWLAQKDDKRDIGGDLGAFDNERQTSINQLPLSIYWATGKQVLDLTRWIQEIGEFCLVQRKTQALMGACCSGKRSCLRSYQEGTRKARWAERWVVLLFLPSAGLQSVQQSGVTAGHRRTLRDTNGHCICSELPPPITPDLWVLPVVCPLKPTKATERWQASALICSDSSADGIFSRIHHWQVKRSVEESSASIDDPDAAASAESTGDSHRPSAYTP